MIGYSVSLTRVMAIEKRETTKRGHVVSSEGDTGIQSHKLKQHAWMV